MDMDKKEILKEAKATIDNINAAQETLNKYLKRLETIVEKLEYQNFKQEKLTISDVENIQEKIKTSEDENKEKGLSKAINEDLNETESFNLAKKAEVANKTATSQVKKNRKNKNGFLSNLLIVVGILFLAFSLVLTIKKVDPNFRFFDHYVYNYDNTNMTREIEKNSLVLIKKLHKDEIVVDDNVAFKDGVDSIKIVQVSEVVDEVSKKYQTKSLSRLNEDEEILERSEILGKVAYTIPLIGVIIYTLIQNLWLIYVISGLIFIIAYLVSKKEVE